MAGFIETTFANSSHDLLDKKVGERLNYPSLANFYEACTQHGRVRD